MIPAGGIRIEPNNWIRLVESLTTMANTRYIILCVVVEKGQEGGPLKGDAAAVAVFALAKRTNQHARQALSGTAATAAQAQGSQLS